MDGTQILTLGLALEAPWILKDQHLDTSVSPHRLDLYFEADQSLTAILKAIDEGEYAPNQVIEDPGFALTSANIGEREMDMWGCVLLSEGFLDK